MTARAVPSHVLPLGVHEAEQMREAQPHRFSVPIIQEASVRPLPRVIVFPPSESETENISRYRHACYVALKEWVSLNVAPSEYETEHEARALARSRAQMELGRELRSTNEDVLLVAAVRDLVIARSAVHRPGSVFGR